MFFLKSVKIQSHFFFQHKFHDFHLANSIENQLSTMKENFIITWFNDSAMAESSKIQTIKDQLEYSVGIFLSSIMLKNVLNLLVT